MKALVDKWEIKKLAEQYPNFLDCPPYVEIEVLPVLTSEAVKRLMAAIKRRTQRKAVKAKTKR